MSLVLCTCGNIKNNSIHQGERCPACHKSQWVDAGDRDLEAEYYKQQYECFLNVASDMQLREQYQESVVSKLEAENKIMRETLEVIRDTEETSRGMFQYLAETALDPVKKDEEAK